MVKWIEKILSLLSTGQEEISISYNGIEIPVINILKSHVGFLKSLPPCPDNSLKHVAKSMYDQKHSLLENQEKLSQISKSIGKSEKSIIKEQSKAMLQLSFIFYGLDSESSEHGTTSNLGECDTGFNYHGW